MALDDGVRRDVVTVSQAERCFLLDAFLKLGTAKSYPDGVCTGTNRGHLKEAREGSRSSSAARDDPARREALTCIPYAGGCRAVG